MQFIAYLSTPQNLAKLAAGDWLIPANPARGSSSSSRRSGPAAGAWPPPPSSTSGRATGCRWPLPALEGGGRARRTSSSTSGTDHDRGAGQEPLRRLDAGLASRRRSAGRPVSAGRPGPVSMRQREERRERRPLDRPSDRLPRGRRGRRRSRWGDRGLGVARDPRPLRRLGDGIVESIRRARGIEKPFSPFHKGDGHVTDDTLMTRVLVQAYDQARPSRCATTSSGSSCR